MQHRFIKKISIYRIIRGIKYIYRIFYTFAVVNYVGKAGKKANIIPDAWIEGGKYIEIGDFFCARSGLRLEAYDYYQNMKYNPRIIIGNNVNVGELCHIGAINFVQVGNNVLMGSKVYITDHQHGENKEFVEKNQAPIERKLYSKGSVIIEDNVWIGDGAVIMPGVRIGYGAIIGANAVVTHNVLPYEIVAGAPARAINTKGCVV